MSSTELQKTRQKKSVKWSETGAKSPRERSGKYLAHKTKSGKQVSPSKADSYHLKCHAKYPPPECDSIRYAYQTRSDAKSRNRQIRCGQIFGCGDITMLSSTRRRKTPPTTPIRTARRRSPSNVTVRTQKSPKKQKSSKTK